MHPKGICSPGGSLARTVIFAMVLGMAGVAHADDSFETKAQCAQRIGSIEGLVWTFTASCDDGDDTEQRQCRKVRDARAAELAGATLLVEGDKKAFEVGAWNAQKKSVPVTLASCVRCAGVEVDGTTYAVVATNGGKLHDNGKQFPDEAAAKAFAKTVANARVQLLVKVPAKPKTQAGGKPAIALDVVGYRVIVPCDGSVVLASPASGPVDADKKQCAAPEPAPKKK
jgi:hypothetical protein